MRETVLVSMEIRFTTVEEPEQLVERVREALRTIVGRTALEDFRWRALPLEPGSPRQQGPD
ncbi:MAG: hypothetical protein M3Q23_06765 [Actinomycetota bacterium]|nr:hypothetical protein [Actinomycetota bacterium]